MLHLEHFNLPKAGGWAEHGHELAHHIFTSVAGKNGGIHLMDPHNREHHAVMEQMIQAGIADGTSAVMAFQEQLDPVRFLIHDAQGKLKAFRANHNLRINYGGSLLLKQIMAADTTGTTNVPYAYYCNQGTITYAAGPPPTVTPGTSPSWTAHAYQDHLFVPLAGGVYAVILDNTTTALTLDQITAISAGTTTNPVTGGTGSLPANNTAFVILPGGAPLLWFALSNDATAPNTTDTSLAGEVTTGGMGRAFCGGAATTYTTVTTAPSGSSTSTNQTAACKVHHVWTASGTVTSIQKAGLFTGAYSASGAGSPSFEATFTSFGTNPSDTATGDWTITNN